MKTIINRRGGDRVSLPLAAWWSDLVLLERDWVSAISTQPRQLLTSMETGWMRCAVDTLLTRRCCAWRATLISNSRHCRSFLSRESGW